MIDPRQPDVPASRSLKNEALIGEPKNDNNLSAEVSIGKGEKVIVIGLIYQRGNLKRQADRIGSFVDSLMSSENADSKEALFRWENRIFERLLNRVEGNRPGSALLR